MEGRNLNSLSLMPATKGQQLGFNVRGLASGFYVVKAQQGSTIRIKKVLVNP
jgi:hypothetical protein